MQFPIATQNLAKVPHARVYNSAALTITTATVTTLTFDTDRYDIGSLHDTAANTSRLTITVPGLYSIKGNVEWANNAVGERLIRFLANGVDIIALDNRNAVNGDTTVQPLACDTRLVAGNYVELQVFQNSGGNLNVLHSNVYSPEFSAHFVSN